MECTVVLTDTHNVHIPTRRCPSLMSSPHATVLHVPCVVMRHRKDAPRSLTPRCTEWSSRYRQDQRRDRRRRFILRRSFDARPPCQVASAPEHAHGERSLPRRKVSLAGAASVSMPRRV